MVNLDVVHKLNTALVQSQPLVAVFFGGTSHISHHTLRALATATANDGKGLRAYIVARNAQVAEGFISEYRGLCPNGQFIFVKAGDLSLIRDIDRLCGEVIQQEEKEGQDARIDYLMLAQGGSIFLSRIDTKEGLDVTMSLMYYSRMRAIVNLLPLLLKSTLPAGARVVSVYAASSEAKLFPEDLSLRDLSHYSYSQARSHMVYMHTFFFETLADQHRGRLSLIHIFPGIVLGPGFNNPEFPLWFKIIFARFFFPIFGRFFAVPSKECGKRMLYLASAHYPPRSSINLIDREEIAIGTDGTPGSGAYSLTWNGENNLNQKKYEKLNKGEMRKKVWDHTLKAFEIIESGKVFTEWECDRGRVSISRLSRIPK